MATVIEVLGRWMAFTQCPVCDVEFAMPNSLNERALKNRGPNGVHFFCPHGHSLHKTGESDETKLRRERDNLKQQMARVEQERDEANALAEKNQRALKRHKKRASAGTCPCCQRTFANMAAHMKQQHPQFVQEQGAKVVPLKRA